MIELPFSVIELPFFFLYPVKVSDMNDSEFVCPFSEPNWVTPFLHVPCYSKWYEWQ